MLLIVVALLFGAPILWTVSVGAVRDARRARQQDPRVGCQAWVAVAAFPGRRYRCCEPVYAGGRWCRRHVVALDVDAEHGNPDAELVDEPQAVGKAIAQARVGIPLAVVTILVVGALVVWVVA